MGTSTPRQQCQCNDYVPGLLAAFCWLAQGATGAPSPRARRVSRCFLAATRCRFPITAPHQTVRLKHMKRHQEEGTFPSLGRLLVRVSEGDLHPACKVMNAAAQCEPPSPLRLLPSGCPRSWRTSQSWPSRGSFYTRTFQELSSCCCAGPWKCVQACTQRSTHGGWIQRCMAAARGCT